VRRADGRILVDGKLAAGDAVVVQGVQGLRVGQRLNPKPFASAGNAGAPAAKRATKGKKN
jgi:hypothetical protein